MSKHKNIYVGLDAYGSSNLDHMTVIWMGSELPPITIMSILKEYKDYKSSEFRKSIKFFGNNKNLLVATIDLAEGSWIKFFRDKLIEEGCKDHSEFEWNPHVTISTIDDFDEPANIYIPNKINLGNPYISISGQRIYA